MDSIDYNDLEFDIAVVGAGPAGSSFARLIDSSIYKIAVIDGQSISVNKPCGGLLAPDAQKLMAKNNFVIPKDVLVDPQIFSVRTIDLCTNIERFYYRNYLNMDRRKFDSYLLSLVPDSIYRIEAKVISIKKNQDSSKRKYMVALRYSDGNTANIFCDYVVGADGASSIVRKTFYNNNILKYLAIQSWFDIEMPANTYYSCIFDNETSESCSWTIQKDGYFIYGGCFKLSESKKSYEVQKNRLSNYLKYDLGTPVKIEACMVCSPRKYSDFITGYNGVWLIGEAAGFISASSLEGISSAIKSGSMLASVMNKSRDADDISKKYSKFAFILKIKLFIKILKHKVIFTPWIRKIIMKSGIQSL